MHFYKAAKSISPVQISYLLGAMEIIQSLECNQVRGLDMNVKRLEGQQLNYWVAMSMRLKLLVEPPSPRTPHDPDSGHWHPNNFHPATNCSHAGPILSNEWYAIEDILIEWFGLEWPNGNIIIHFPLIWFLRAYVASQFGDEVEDIIPGHGSWSMGSLSLTPIQRRTPHFGMLKERLFGSKELT